ncbi:MAG: universal stress protein [Litorilinea sp.]
MTDQKTNQTHAILACIDGSIYADSVCGHAAWAAQRLGLGVRLLHVQEPHPTKDVPTERSGNLILGQRTKLLERLAQMDEERGKLDLQKGRLILAHAKEELAEAGVEQVETLHRRGSLVETLAELEGATNLILIGKRGEHADFADLHLGSNLERVVRGAHKPIMVCSRAFKPIAQFAVAYDGGASTARAVSEIANNTLFRGLTCHLLHVGDETSTARQMTEQAAATLQAGGIQVQVVIRGGHPDKVIPAYVTEQSIDLLVMGAYGHSRIRTLIIGSTTSAMIRGVRIPLLLFR